MYLLPKALDAAAEGAFPSSPLPSLLFCFMYLLGQSGSNVSTMAWFSLMTLSILCSRLSVLLLLLPTLFLAERSVGTDC